MFQVLQHGAVQLHALAERKQQEQLKHVGQQLLGAKHVMTRQSRHSTEQQATGFSAR